MLDGIICRNNPLVYTDPSGHSWLSDLTGIHIGWDDDGFHAYIDSKQFTSFVVTAASFYVAGGLPGSSILNHMVAGTFSGGFSSAIQGGDVGMGMLTGGLSAGIAEFAAPYLPNNGFIERLASRSVVGGITGGVTSELYGGNFGDGFGQGAKYAAYGFVFNHVLHDQFGAPKYHKHGDNSPSWGSDNGEGPVSIVSPETGGTMAFSEMARDLGTYYLGVIGTAAGGTFAKEAFVSLMVAAGTPSNQILLQGIAEFANDYWGNGSPGVTRFIEKAINSEPLTSP